MEFSEIVNYVRRRLGEPVLKVEADNLQIEDCLINALLWFSVKKGLIFERFITTQEDQSECVLQDDVEDVLGVVFTARDYLMRDDFGFSLYGIPYFGGMFMAASPRTRGQLFSYSSLVQWLQYVEMGKRVLGADQNWEFYRPTRTLRFTPRLKDNGQICYIYKKVLEQKDIPNLTVSDLDLLRRYTLAEVKEILGRIRSKYQSVPAAGGEINLDGATLLDESKAEKERLEEEIGETSLPMPFVVG